MSWAAPLRARAPATALVLVVYGDLAGDIENAILGFFKSIWDGITSFFGTIFGGLANLIAQIFEAPVIAVQDSFQQLDNWASQFGPFAPIITVAITAVVLILIVWVIWLVIKLAVSEGEQTLGEAEEGV